MGPNVTCIMRWRKKNMSFIPMIPILTSIRPGCLPLFPEYASAMNVYPCASSSTSTRYTPMRKTVVSLREKHRSRLSWIPAMTVHLLPDWWNYVIYNRYLLKESSTTSRVMALRWRNLRLISWWKKPQASLKIFISVSGRQLWVILIRQPMKPITKYSSRKRTAREKESGRDTFGWLSA